ncbi:MAG: hypothetical protein Q9220_004960 [cf. Caloplaca sp. 1 TL-2023]
MSDRRRRKSLSIFRPPLSPLTPINDEPTESSPGTLKKRRPTSFAQTQSPVSSPANSSKNSPGLSSPGADSTESPSKGGWGKLIPRTRPRSLHKDGRPSSFFGSLRSLTSLHDEEEELTKTASSPSSLNSVNSAIPDVAAGLLVHHGPLPEVGPIFRRRSPYLVLTDTHLVKFKSQDRAAETFPSIPPTSTHQKRTNKPRHSRLSSTSSTQDLQTSADCHMALVHVVAVYKLDDGQPYFTFEVAYLSDTTNHPSTLTIQIHDPRESDTWITAIRSAASRARIMTSTPFSQRLVEHTARALEQEHDYDPNHFHMFKVVQRANKLGKRSSSEDLRKLTSKLCILAIGMYKVHIVPLPKASKAMSSTSLSEMNGLSYGIVTLTSINVQAFDDTFQLWFRQPFQSSSALHLAALCVNEIAVWLRQAAEYLRPEWTEPPFAWIVPEILNDELLPVPVEEEENRAFDRTLTAYCAAYGIDTSQIRYAIDYEGEDAPAFWLMPLANPGREKYNSIELLAIFRALRYNETFRTISFSQTSLDVIHGLCDPHGWEHTPWSTRSGEPIELEDQQNASVLIQEIRALAIKSRRLRRMDFSECLERKPSTAGAASAGGCGVCEALFPLCAKQYTNVDWVVLNGIQLASVDIDYLYAAAIDKSCHFRAIAVGYCDLADRDLQTILSALAHQGATLECVDFSGNLARLEPLVLQEHFDELSCLRQIDLSNTYRTSGREPLFESRTLIGWKLEMLDLARSSINAETITALAKYLRHPQSDTLRNLRLDDCGLTGGSVADLLQAMSRPGPRRLHLSISGSHLEQEHERLIKAIESSLTPTEMSLQMLEYKDELNFQQLVLAFAHNYSTIYLDVSKVSLPFEASEGTFMALEHMLRDNETLEYLDLAGEEAHLEVANFGSGLNLALVGLKGNKSLKVLHVEHQKLGMPGANALASVLEENSTLQELHCAFNGFNLQAFTVIVSSLVKNKTLVHLPYMEKDRATAIDKVNKEVVDARDTGIRSLTAPKKITMSTMKRSLGAAMLGSRHSYYRRSGPPAKPKKADSELKGVAKSIAQKWDRETMILQGYLQRNYDLANGPPRADTVVTAENERPATDWSAATTLRVRSDDATPVGEPGRQLGHGIRLTSTTTVDDKESPGFEGDGALGGVLMMSQRLSLE